MNGATFRIYVGDALARLRELPDASAHALITSPPYWALRDYGVSGQLGLEATPAEYVDALVEVFREARRVLRPDGTAWVNLGDSYAQGGRGSPGAEASTLGGLSGQRASFGAQRARGDSARKPPPDSKPKDLLGMPWRVAFALQDDGWWIRNDCVWHKPNPQPEAVEDRPTRDHEYVFMLSQREHYFADMEAVRQPVTGNAHVRGAGTHKKSAVAGSGIRQNASFSAAVRGLVERRNLRTVWTIQTQPSQEEHFAGFPVALPELCIRMATSEWGCCRRCGAPVARRLEKVRCVDGVPAPDLPAARTTSKEAPSGKQGVGHWRISTDRQTVGVDLGCTCFAGPPVPCTVLDCFGGLMTTGVAALKLGRNFVGVELNPEYAALGERRLVQFGAAHPEQPAVPAAAKGSSRPVQLSLTDQR